MRSLVVCVLAISLALLSGCGIHPRTLPTSTFPPATAATVTIAPTESPSPPPTATRDSAATATAMDIASATEVAAPISTASAKEGAALTPTATAIPTFTPRPESPSAEGQVIGGQVNLRAGPSLLFPILQTLAYGTPLGVLSAAPGREWFQVRAADGLTGWMLAEYVQIDLVAEAVALTPLSADWLTLKGSVKDSNGQPVVNAYIMLYDAQGHITFTQSWEDSYFYLFLPESSQGRWTLKVLRPACLSASSTPACPGMGYFLDNPRVLDISGNQSVELVYQLYRP